MGRKHMAKSDLDPCIFRENVVKSSGKNECAPA